MNDISHLVLSILGFYTYHKKFSLCNSISRTRSIDAKAHREDVAIIQNFQKPPGEVVHYYF